MCVTLPSLSANSNRWLKRARTRPSDFAPFWNSITSARAPRPSAIQTQTGSIRFIGGYALEQVPGLICRPFTACASACPSRTNIKFMYAKLLLAMSLITLTKSAFSEPLVSPEVHPDRSVTFRLKAPDAKEVVLRYDLGTNTLERNEQGVWSVTTEPLEPDIYSYSFLVDGL